MTKNINPYKLEGKEKDLTSSSSISNTAHISDFLIILCFTEAGQFKADFWTTFLKWKVPYLLIQYMSF